MDRFVKHVGIPLLATIAVVALYFTPKTTFGCANRGLMALGVVGVCTLGAMGSTVKGAVEKTRHHSDDWWWLLTTLLLLLPTILVFGPLA